MSLSKLFREKGRERVGVPSSSEQPPDRAATVPTVPRLRGDGASITRTTGNRPAGRHGNARPASWTSALASHDTDGVIVVISETTEDQLRQLRSGGIPLVVVDPANPPPPDVASVGATNWAGGLAATEHLLGLGHRRIAAVGGPEDYLCSRARI